MKNILHLLDKAIEELEKGLSTYKTCYDLNTAEIADLKAKLAETEGKLKAAIQDRDFAEATSSARLQDRKDLEQINANLQSEIERLRAQPQGDQ